ncbi:hypothetical protein V8E53_005689 [Lactarius tabidus]
MVNGFVITPVLLCFHLQENKVPSHHITYQLNHTDCQDVMLCFILLKEICTLPPPAPTDKPRFVAARGCTLIHDQLVHLSAIAHLVFYLTLHKAQSKAMLSLTFKDIILLIKNAYFCVAKARICMPGSATTSPLIHGKEGNVNARNLVLTSEFLASKIKEALLELESKGHNMEFPFCQAKSPKESDDDKCDGTPAATSLLRKGYIHTQINKGDEPIFLTWRTMHQLKPATMDEATLPPQLSSAKGNFFWQLYKSMRYWLILPLCLIKISPCFLVELTVNVQFQIYQVIETSQDDPDIDSADWKWNCNLEQTAGSFIQVISPAITIPEVYTPVYYFQVDELQAIAACLFSSVPVQDQYEFPQLLKRSSHFPYHPTNAIPWDISKTHKILEHVAML